MRKLLKGIIIICIMMSVFMTSNQTSPIKDVHAAYSSTSDAYTLVNYLNGKVGEAYTANRCQAFVYNSLVNALGVYGAKACAYEAWLDFGVSTDKEIPLGAAVYFSGGGYPCGNHIAGHVGLYVGDGYVVHVAQSKVQKTLVSTIESWSGYSYLGWGWQGGYALANYAPDTTPPTNCTLTIEGGDESNHFVNDIIPIYFSADGAEYYNMVMYKEQDIYYQERFTYGYCAATFSQPGHYCCYIEAVNSSGSITSRWVGWNIYKKANITVDRGNNSFYVLGENIIISIDDDEAEKHYIGIHKDDNYYTGDCITGNTYEFKPSEPGNYKVNTDAVFSTGNMRSEYCYFQVVKKPSVTIENGSNIFQINENVTFNATADSSSSQLWIGIHKDGVYYDGFCMGSNNEKYVRSFSEPGNYYVNVESIGDYGSLQSEKIYFTVENYIPPSPSNVKLTMNKETYSSYTVNEMIKFNYSAVDANEYTLIVEKSGEPYREYMLSNGTFEFSLNDVGEYSARLKVTNDVGEAYSDWVVWYVQFPETCTPRSVVYVNEKVYCIYDIPLTWNSAEKLCVKLGGKLAEIENTLENQSIVPFLQGTYWLGGTDKDNEGIWLWSSGESFEYNNWATGQPDNWNGMENYLSIDYAGTWNDCLIDNIAINGFVCEFEKPRTSSTVTQKEKSVTIETDLYNISSPCVILFVGYNENKFVTMKKTPYSGESVTCMLEGDIDELKVMVWDSVSSQVPICDVQTIPQSEWIIE